MNEKPSIEVTQSDSEGARGILAGLRDFIAGRSYAFLFAALYAGFLGTLFYPGLPYSDSVARWLTAISVANDGIGALVGVSDHSPVLPILVMAVSYRLTGEVGFFTLIQVFLLAYSLFLIVRHFAPGVSGNILASLALLLPVNQVYAVFMSYDSLFAVLLLLLFVTILGNSKWRFVWIPVLLAALIGTRLNAIVLLPVVLVVLFLQRRSFPQFHYGVLFSMSVVLTAAVLLLPAAFQMTRGNSWLIGTAWEYANLATKTNDKRDVSFLRSVGVTPERLQNGICYTGIWCGKEYELFINKLGSERGPELMRNYLLVAWHYPGIFWVEKWKYIKSLMGAGIDPLKNVEIGRWREDHWKVRMRLLGFETSPKKEALVNRFNRSFGAAGEILLKPWAVFALMSVFTAYLKRHESRVIGLTAIAFAYYGSFFISSQNHELRYFYPVALVFLTYIVVILALLANRIGDFLMVLTTRPRNSVEGRRR